MDFERLERAWNGPANSPNEAAGAYVADTMMQTLRRRRQATAAFTRFIGALLVLMLAVIVFRIAMKPVSFDLAREWPIAPLLALPWVGLILIRRQQKLHMTAHPDPYASVRATLRGLLGENAAARTRLRLIGGLMLAAIVVGGWMLRQLVAVGKMTPTNALQASIAIGAIVAAVGAYRAWHYLRVLNPEAKRLERLLADYSAAA